RSRQSGGGSGSRRDAVSHQAFRPIRSLQKRGKSIGGIMNVGPGNLFAEFLDDYFAESEEHLATARRNLLILDNSTGGVSDQAAIGELLRSFHSLKGLSAMVGVNEITQASHLVEEYLREVQATRSTPDVQGVETLMQAVDSMEVVLAARRKGATTPNISEI